MSEMIQPVVQRAKSGFDFREVDQDTRCRVDFAVGVHFDTERAAMQARALVASGSRAGGGQSFETELAEHFHQGIPRN